MPAATKPLAAIFCGDRGWSWAQVITDAFDRLAPAAVITGGARGADACAYEEARVRGIPVLVCEAQWARYGKAAGPVRNEVMLEQLLTLYPAAGWRHACVAFHNYLPASRGTADMVGKARAAGVPTTVTNSKGVTEELLA